MSKIKFAIRSQQDLYLAVNRYGNLTVRSRAQYHATLTAAQAVYDDNIACLDDDIAAFWDNIELFQRTQQRMKDMIAEEQQFCDPTRTAALRIYQAQQRIQEHQRTLDYYQRLQRFDTQRLEKLEYLKSHQFKIVAVKGKKILDLSELDTFTLLRLE